MLGETELDPRDPQADWQAFRGSSVLSDRLLGVLQ